jgi:hypothetical protein
MWDGIVTNEVLRIVVILYSLVLEYKIEVILAKYYL